MADIAPDHLIVVSSFTMRHRSFFFVLLASIAVLRTAAQQPAATIDRQVDIGLATPSINSTGSGPGSAYLDRLSNLEKKTLPLEIAVAGYYDLVAMVKKLGLSESGSAAQIRERIYAFYGIAPFSSDRDTPAVLIEKADRASLFGLEGVDGSAIRVTGGVRLSVRQKDGTIHRISARSINYDKERNAVSAEGAVRYERESGNNHEIFTGSMLVADLDDWTGVFLDGGFTLSESAIRQGNTAGQPATTAAASAGTSIQGLLGSFGTSVSGLTIKADRIIKRTGDVILVQDARMTSCDDEEPHYVINAGKAWILGNGDWAVADAALFIGGVPVLWLPFFYFPSEEIFFHPVIGNRTREGSYFQTTTWLIGEKAHSSSTGSFLSFGQDQADGERRIEGVFFRTRPKTPGTTSATEKLATVVSTNDGSGNAGGKYETSFLKLLVDAYSNLGIYSGLEGSFSDRNRGSNISFTVGIGLSRSLFYTSNGSWSPYSAASDWHSVWDKTDLGFIKLPFRFGAELKTTFPVHVGKTTLRGSFALPVFSDPYFEQDFRGRTDDMEWLKIFSSATTDSSRPSRRGALIQKLDFSGSYTPGIAGVGRLSSIDINRLGVSATWYTKTASFTPFLTGSAATLFAANPQRDFFYPDTIRFLDFSTTLKGNFFRFPTSMMTPDTTETLAISAYRLPISRDLLPGGQTQAEGGNVAPQTSDKLPTTKTESGQFDSTMDSPNTDVKSFRLPGLSGTTNVSPFTAKSAGKAFAFTADWNLSPTAFFEDRFRSDSWETISDIDLSLFYSLLSLRLTGGIDTRAGLFNDLATITAGLGFLGQEQTRPYFFDNRTDTSTIHPLLLSDYQYRTAKVTGVFQTSMTPFRNSWLWALSSVSYNISANIFNYRYSGMSGPGQTGNPLYNQSFIGWDRDSITAHNTSLNFSIRPSGLTQQMTLTANLPPLDETYTFLINLDGGFVKLNAQGQLVHALSSSVYQLNPVTAGIVLGVASSPRLASTFVYNIQGASPDSSTTTLSWKALSTSLMFRYSSGYVLTPSRTWISDGIQTFRANTFTAGFNPSIQSEAGTKNPWSVSLTTGLTQNLLRFSESSLNLGLISKINLGKDFSLSFMGTTRNTSAWRYYTFLFKPSGTFDPSVYNRNIIADIADSISIWNPAALKRSLLKLSSLSISMQQNLHDWDLGATVKASPLLVEPSGIKPYYTLDVSLSLLVKWHDIPGISTTITRDSSGLSY